MGGVADAVRAFALVSGPLVSSAASVGCLLRIPMLLVAQPGLRVVDSLLRLFGVVPVQRRPPARRRRHFSFLDRLVDPAILQARATGRASAALLGVGLLVEGGCFLLLACQLLSSSLCALSTRWRVNAIDTF
jgi:hypothetical protein